jgi:hypothetical protein
VWFHRLRAMSMKINFFSQSSVRARAPSSSPSNRARHSFALSENGWNTRRIEIPRSRASRRRTSTPSVIHAKNKIPKTRFARRARMSRVASSSGRVMKRRLFRSPRSRE